MEPIVIRTTVSNQDRGQNYLKSKLESIVDSFQTSLQGMSASTDNAHKNEVKLFLKESRQNVSLFSYIEDVTNYSE